MSILLLKNVNFGSGKSGLSTVGYRLLDTSGNLSGSRITAGVGEILADSGLYSASVHFSNSFSGSIVWDTGGSGPVYATEEYNGINEKVEFIRDIEGGRWKIDSSTNEMIFFKQNNTSVVARFGLSGSTGTPQVSNVFERNRNS